MWTRKQRGIRQAVIDRLRYWQGNGHVVRWVTLTSSPASGGRLRADFQALKKRIEHRFGYQFEYACVDTREGHGVLHMLWALRGDSFFVPFRWLQETWKELHGAWHVNIKDVGRGDSDARRLSRYIVAQYCGGQVGLVRFSQSRCAVPLGAMRRAW